MPGHRGGDCISSGRLRVGKTPTPFTYSVFDNWFFSLLRTGHVGVQLFFIISGFVVALPFAMHHLADGKKVNLRRFFLRRLTRIEPPYMIALIFWLLAFGHLRAWASSRFLCCFGTSPHRCSTFTILFTTSLATSFPRRGRWKSKSSFICSLRC